MGHNRKAARQQAMVRRQSRLRRRLSWCLVVAGLMATIVALVILTKPLRYSGFDAIGQHPAIVQVFLPG
jgi:hypothetical protein